MSNAQSARVLLFRPRDEMPTEDQLDRLAAQDGLYQLIHAYGAADVVLWVYGKPGATVGLYNLVAKYGADRVMTWVRFLAPIAGQEVS